MKYVFEDNPHTLRTRLNVGMTGMGKSSLLRWQLQQIQKTNGRYILVDPAKDNHNFGKFGRVVTVKELATLLGPKTLRKFAFRVQINTPGRFDYLCWEAMRQGDCFLLVDEVWNFCETKGGTKMEPENFNALMTQGRHQQVRFLGTCQRPTQVHNNLVLLCQEINVFRTEDINGALKTKLLHSHENRDRVLALKPGQFLQCKDATVKLCEVPR